MEAQKILHQTDKIFNWGGKIGCNSIISNIRSLSIDNVEMLDIQQKYKVGYQASLFGRINFDKFFMEPSVIWQHTEADIHFNIPQSNVTSDVNQEVYAPNLLQSKYSTLEVPVMIGYYLVKEEQYALALSVGPAFRYNYKTTFSTNMIDNAREYKSDNTPLGIGLGMGIGASIGKLFLNFHYQFGLNEVDSDFQEINSSTEETTTLKLEKRTNILSFSLGFML